MTSKMSFLTIMFWLVAGSIIARFAFVAIFADNLDY